MVKPVKAFLPSDRYFDPDPRQKEIAQSLYELVKEAPLVCPHGHVDPRLFADTLDQVERNYVKDISHRELMEAAIKGILTKLDPYSSKIDEWKKLRNLSGVYPVYRGFAVFSYLIKLRDLGNMSYYWDCSEAVKEEFVHYGFLDVRIWAAPGCVL